MNVFDRFAEKYDEWYEKPFGRSAYKLEAECIRKLIKGDGIFLEVGVGTGRFARELNIKFGLDPSFEMLKIAKERGIRTVLGKAESLPFKDKTFDAVFIIVSICFIDEPESALKEAKRVLKDNGYLVLGLILKDSVWAEYYMKKAEEGHPIYRHARFYSFKEIKRLLERNEFKIDAVLSTLIEEPHDEGEVKNRRIEEGFSKLSGFTCIRALNRGEGT